MNITEDYVSFEVAKLLKEKGFDEPCYLGYNKNGDYFPTNNRSNSQIIQPDFCFICCPTHQMVMKWLREEYKIHIYVVPIWEDVEYQYGQWEEELTGYRYHIVSVGKYNNTYEYPNTKAITVESSYNAGIKYVLENLI